MKYRTSDSHYVFDTDLKGLALQAYVVDTNPHFICLLKRFYTLRTEKYSIQHQRIGI